jgi:hypothetical protein
VFSQVFSDPASIGQAPQGQDPIQVAALDRRYKRTGPGSQKKLVVRKLLPPAAGNFLQIFVDPDNLVLDHRDAGGFEHFIGNDYRLINDQTGRYMGQSSPDNEKFLFPDHRHIDAGHQLFGHHCRWTAGTAAADNDELFSIFHQYSSILRLFQQNLVAFGGLQAYHLIFQLITYTQNIALVKNYLVIGGSHLDISREKSRPGKATGYIN